MVKFSIYLNRRVFVMGCISVAVPLPSFRFVVFVCYSMYYYAPSFEEFRGGILLLGRSRFIRAFVRLLLLSVKYNGYYLN